MYEIEINLPQAKVAELFTNSSYFTQWQKGLTDFRQTDGELWNVGSRFIYTFKSILRTYRIKETVTANDLPDGIEFLVFYNDINYSKSIVFKKTSELTTIIMFNIKFRRSAKKITWLFSWIIKRQIWNKFEKQVWAFKEFAEKLN